MSSVPYYNQDLYAEPLATALENQRIAKEDSRHRLVFKCRNAIVHFKYHRYVICKLGYWLQNCKRGARLESVLYGCWRGVCDRCKDYRDGAE